MARTARIAVVLATLCAFAPAAARAERDMHVTAGGGTTTGDNGPATSASIQTPLAVATLRTQYIGSRDFVVADRAGCRIRRVVADPNMIENSGTISTVAGNGSCGNSSAISQAS